MAPVAQNKGRKASVAAKKEAAAQKQERREDTEEQMTLKGEEQKHEEQEANEGAGAQREAEKVAGVLQEEIMDASIARADTAEDAGTNAPEMLEDMSLSKDETAAITEEAKENETKAAETEEITATTEEDPAAGEDTEAMNKDGDGEGTGDVEKASADEEDALMRDGDGNDNEEAEGSGGQDDAKDDHTHLSAGKIFIGGLSRETTTEALTRHFEKYGELTDSVIMKNRGTGQPRGFGFVTYADPSVVDRVLQDTHVLDGKTVDAKRTVPREKMVAEAKGPKTKKIFVGGLKSSSTEEDLKTYFGKFGKISGCQIMQDHQIRKSRGFGFVTFDSEQVVEDILAQGTMHEIDGKQVEIKKAEPKGATEPPPRPKHNRSAYFSGGRRGTGYNANPGYFGGFNDATDTPYYGGAAGYYNRSGARAGGLAYGYGGGYGGSLGYGDIDDGYGYNHAGYVSGSYGSSAGSYGPAGPYGSGGSYGSYGSGSSYGYSFGGGGGYGPSNRGYGSGRHHPYGR